MSARPAPFDCARIRAEFPALAADMHGQPGAYLDNAATTQKPLAVLAAIEAYYRHDNANVHRAAHALAERATAAFEDAREQVRAFIGAAHGHEVIWTRGTTEAINLVAASHGRSVLRAGDNVVVTLLEHHSNFVPWQQVAAACGAELRVIPLTATHELDLAAAARLIDARTRIVAFGHVSNALGIINPVGPLVAMARAAGAVTLVDGAQAVAHLAVDVQALGCDFYAFSGHKAFGPTGIGVLYGREALLEAMPPWQFGGEMIETVGLEASTWNRLPWKFEAGTPHIAGAIGLGAALRWLQSIDRVAARAHEDAVRGEAEARLQQVPGVQLVAGGAARTGVVSFAMDGAHPHDIGTLLDRQGVAIRSGHHCAMPLMGALGLPGTARASFALYNDRDDVERLVRAVEKARTLL